MIKKQFILPEKLKGYSAIIGFMFALFISNLLWKYNIKGDEASNLASTVTLWGMDISAPFNQMASTVATSCTTLLKSLGWSVSLDNTNTIRHLNGNGVRIIWACSGIKQAYIFVFIMIFARGNALKKIAYTTIGLIVVHLFNILRIAFITATVQSHQNWFVLLHEYITKYAFYALIFAIWVYWEEKIADTQCYKKKE